MSHSADRETEYTEPVILEPRLRFYQKWSPFERIVVIVLVVAVISMVAQPIIQRQVDAKQNAKIAAQAREQRKCLADRLDALREYLDARGSLADRDRAANAAVFRAFAEAARTQSQDPADIIRSLKKWETRQRKIAEDRSENPLPEFPGGDCLSKGSGSTKPGVVESPAPTEDVVPSSAPSSPSEASSSASGTVGQKSSGSSSNGSGGSSNGGGNSGGGGPTPAPVTPTKKPIVDLELNIPNLLSVSVGDGQPKITPVEGGLLDPDPEDESDE